MSPRTRTIVLIIPLLFQGMAMLLGITAVSFFVPGVVNFLKKHEGKLEVPAPTKLLIENPGAAKFVVVGLFSISLLTFLFTRVRMKEEADRLAVQGAVYGAVWYAGIIFVGGALMAAALPYFALNPQ
jgi:hypothetical protein